MKTIILLCAMLLTLGLLTLVGCSDNHAENISGVPDQDILPPENQDEGKPRAKALPADTGDITVALSDTSLTIGEVKKIYYPTPKPR